MQMQRRQFCLAVSVGVASTMVGTKPARAGIINTTIGVSAAVIGTIASVVVIIATAPVVIVIATAVAIVAAVVSAICLGLHLFGVVSTTDGADVAGIASVRRGEGAASLTGNLSAEDLPPTLAAPLSHITQSAIADPELVSVNNGLIDAYNRLRSDLLAGEGVDGALVGVRQAVETVQMEIGRRDLDSFTRTAAELAAGQQQIRSDGLPGSVTNILSGCGFSTVGIEAIRQEIAGTDLTGAEQKTVPQALSEIASNLPASVEATVSEDVAAPGREAR